MWRILETHHCMSSTAFTHTSFTRCSNPNRLCFSGNTSVLFKYSATDCTPGGTPGSNILIKLICKILTMWVFRWLLIWCERTLCFHWKDTDRAGTCFSKTLQKIIAVELSWVRAITNDSVCLSPRGTQFLHHLCFRYLWWRPVSAFLRPRFFFPQQFDMDDS